MYNDADDDDDDGDDMILNMIIMTKMVLMTVMMIVKWDLTQVRLFCSFRQLPPLLVRQAAGVSRGSFPASSAFPASLLTWSHQLIFFSGGWGGGGGRGGAGVRGGEGCV